MYQRILVPFDGSPTSTRGLDEALRIAQMTHGRLRVLHVIDELSLGLALGACGGYVGDFDCIGAMRDDAQQMLQKARDSAAAAGIEVETVLHDTYAGQVHELVNAEARQWPAELIVLGTHGRRGVGRMLLGSSAEKILRSAPVPVLLVRAPGQEGQAQAAAQAAAA